MLAFNLIKTERNTNVHGQFSAVEGWRNLTASRWVGRGTKLMWSKQKSSCKIMAQTKLQDKFENLVDYVTNPTRLLQQIDEVVEDDSLHQTELSKQLATQRYFAYVRIPNKNA